MRERLTMKFSYITVETFGKVVVIRLDAPERLNRLDKEMGVELQSALNQIEEYAHLIGGGDTRYVHG
jgi:enoyl-CoA hydratase/carnithine racemase